MTKKNESPSLTSVAAMLGPDAYVSEVASDAAGLQVRGRFELPRYAMLTSDHAQFLETFLRCRGILSTVEKEMGMSYPTVRARLDALLEALGLTPVKERRDRGLDDKRRILDLLERGEITPEEAKEKLHEEVRR